MRITAPASIRRLRQAIIEQRPEPRRRDDRGLTTLEWLLIVAAVAGLAALAVVLVTNVVRDTSEQISGRSARLTSAQVQAQSITDEAAATTVADEVARLGRQCENLKITYSGVEEIDTGAAFWTLSSKKCEVVLKP